MKNTIIHLYDEIDTSKNGVDVYKISMCGLFWRLGYELPEFLDEDKGGKFTEDEEKVTCKKCIKFQRRMWAHNIALEWDGQNDFALYMANEHGLRIISYHEGIKGDAVKGKEIYAAFNRGQQDHYVISQF